MSRFERKLRRKHPNHDERVAAYRLAVVSQALRRYRTYKWRQRFAALFPWLPRG